MEEESGCVLEGCGVEVEEGAVRFRQPSSRSLPVASALAPLVKSGETRACDTVRLDKQIS